MSTRPLLSRDAFGHMLTAALDLRGMTGRALAFALDKRESTVSNWRTGRALPTDGELTRIGDVLGWDDAIRARAATFVRAARQ